MSLPPATAATLAPATLPTTGVAVAGLVAAGQSGPSGRRRAAFVLLSATVLLLAPVRHHWSRRPVDSFPLSYYPMFSSPRGRSAAVVHPVGVRSDGTRVDLSYRLCGDGGFNQVRRQITRTVADGRAGVLAERVAAAVVSSLASSPDLADVRRVEIVTGRYRYDRFFAGDRSPHQVRVHATADVPVGARS